MRAWVIGLLSSATALAAEVPASSSVAALGVRRVAPLHLGLTSGRLSVLDVRGVQSASSEDPSVVMVGSFEHDQIVLLGGRPGETSVSVWVGAPPRKVAYVVSVTRDAVTPQPMDGVLHLSVLHERAVRVPSLNRVAVGDASTCDAAIEGQDTLVLTPRRPGMTSLMLWSGGSDASHRRHLLIDVKSRGVVRNLDEVDAVLTEPLDGRVVLVAGEQALIGVSVATRVAIGNEAVARVRPSSSGALIIEACAAGATWLRVWTGSGPPERHFVVVHGRIRNADADEPYFEPAEFEHSEPSPPEPAAPVVPGWPAQPPAVQNPTAR